MLLLFYFLISFTIITNLIGDVNCTNVNDLSQDEIRHTINQLMETDIRTLCQHKFLFSRQWYSVYSKTLAPRICRYYTQSGQNLGDIVEKAALNGDLPVVKYLLNENRFTPKDRALIKRNISYDLAIVCGNKFHVSPSLVGETTAENNNINANAVQIEILGFLLENGADIHANNEKALDEASVNGNLDVVKFLIAKGANIHAQNDAAVRWASQNGQLDVVKFLLEKGANIHVMDDEALRLASEHGHLDVVEFLVEKGANIHAQNDAAVRWACYKGHLDVVRFLVERGANIRADNDDALCWASFKGQLDVIKFLLEKGANIHANDNSALRSAVEYGHLDVVKFLVEKGGYMKANYDRAILLASQKRRLDIVKFLKQNRTNN